MARTANCPSCGAAVVFRSAGSILAVCEYCQSTLVRQDQKLEDIGKMAALAEDRSPLQLGAEGRWQGVHFALIGRIQLKYSQGLWNEWYLLFDDMRSGWLSEAGGEFVISFLQPPGGAAPAFADLQPDQDVSVGGRVWRITNVENAECVAGEGELPFKVGAGYAAPVADLRAGDDFATLDYSESPPLFFVGRPIRLAELAMSGLREEGAVADGPALATSVFRCPSCASPLSARNAEIKAVGCASCGAVVDTSDKNYQLISKALGQDEERYAPRLPLGTSGTLDGQAVEVIGFLVKQTQSGGLTYRWREYLLAATNGDARGTYRWLVEENGHWNVCDVLSRALRPGPGKVRYDNEDFRHFSSCSAEVVQVQGEFTWRVARGETNAVSDYVAPPRMISCEKNEREVVWSLSRYLTPAEIGAAFALKVPLPEAVGVYADQPSPWAEVHRRTSRLFWRFTLIALVLQVVALFAFSGQTLQRQQLRLTPETGGESSVTTPVFDVKKAGKVTVRTETALNNNWIGLNLALVDQQSGAVWPASREISYYSGVEDNERWSEGDKSDEVAFTDVPPGRYALVVEPDFSPETHAPVPATLEIRSGGANWSNYLLASLYFLIFPIYTWIRRAGFETRRWAESDHAPADSDDDDD